MRLFEAILDANHRALKGDTTAGIRPDEFMDELPLIVLTCIDPRLNPLFPSVLGLPEDQFIWLRNAGNVITGPMTSTMRSFSLACAVKGGKEITLTRGQSYYEDPNDIHIVSRNASSTKSAKFLVFLINKKGAPLVIPAK